MSYNFIYLVCIFQDALVLLDLLGCKNPRFRDFFPETSKIFKRLQTIGKWGCDKGMMACYTS